MYQGHIHTGTAVLVYDVGCINYLFLEIELFIQYVYQFTGKEALYKKELDLQLTAWQGQGVRVLMRHTGRSW